MTRIGGYPPSPAALAVERPQVENRRQRLIVRLVFLVYILYLLEGPLRKWALPQYASVLYFLRDPVVMAVYLVAFGGGLVRLKPWMQSWLAVAGVVSAGGLAGLALNGLGPIVWLLALRSYWLYMPLAFVVSACFTARDLGSFVRLNMLVAMPIAALVVLQSNAPPDALINRAIDADAQVALVTAGVVRPYGLFTYTSQQVIYAASILSLVGVGWMMRSRVQLGAALLLPGTGAALVIGLMTGSRTIYFFVLQLVAVLLLVAATTRSAGQKVGSVLVIAAMVGGGAGLFATVLRPAFDAMQVRQEQAVASEGSAIGRALGTVTSAGAVLGDTPLIGHGLGIGTTTVAAWTGRDFVLAYGENEWERLVSELGPILGPCFIGARIVFVFFLLGRALRASRSGAPEGLVLLGFAAVVLLNGQVTFSSAIGFLAWLYAGLILAVTERHSATAMAAPSRFGLTPMTKSVALQAVSMPAGPVERVRPSSAR